MSISQLCGGHFFPQNSSRVTTCTNLSAEVRNPSWGYYPYSDLPECAIGCPCGKEAQYVRIADRDHYSRHLVLDHLGRCDNGMITSGRGDDVIQPRVSRCRTEDVDRNIRGTQYFAQPFCSILQVRKSVPVRDDYNRFLQISRGPQSLEALFNSLYKRGRLQVARTSNIRQHVFVVLAETG